MFAFGTPPARAFLMTLKSAMFFSGSAEPPSEVYVHIHKYKSPGAPRGEGRERLTTRGYHNVLGGILSGCTRVSERAPFVDSLRGRLVHRLGRDGCRWHLSFVGFLTTVMVGRSSVQVGKDGLREHVTLL